MKTIIKVLFVGCIMQFAILECSSQSWEWSTVIKDWGSSFTLLMKTDKNKNSLIYIKFNCLKGFKQCQ